MAASHETILYDVHDFKVYDLTADTAPSATYGAGVDVFGIADVSLDPEIKTAELKGDARIIAMKGRTDRLKVKATYGKLSLDVLAIVLGGTTTDPDTDTAQWDLVGTNSLPYFKAEFKVQDVDEDLGDLHVVLYKCKVSGGTLLNQKTDAFGQPTLEFEAIPTEASDALVTVKLLKSVTPLDA